MISEIRLRQFRSYLDSTFSFSPGVNVIVGPNASGKTNLLEAAMLVSTGKSYRSNNHYLVKEGCDWARVDAVTNNDKRTLKLTLQPTMSKEFVVNNRASSRLPIKSQHPVVLFEPNCLLIITGSPELRRSYLDEILKQTRPGYAGIVNQYTKTVRQRNALIKQRDKKREEIFPWNIRLSQLAGKIVAERASLIETLNNDLTKTYRSLSGQKENIKLKYKTNINLYQYENNLFNQLEAEHELDALRGYTNSGPHREDVEILINNNLPTDKSSRGEVRSLLLSMKYLERNILIKYLGTKPLLLLDDVFSELDQTRRGFMNELFSGSQAIITTIEKIKLPTSGTQLINLLNQ